MQLQLQQQAAQEQYMRQQQLQQQAAQEQYQRQLQQQEAIAAQVGVALQAATMADQEDIRRRQGQDSVGTAPGPELPLEEEEEDDEEREARLMAEDLKRRRRERRAQQAAELAAAQAPPSPLPEPRQPPEDAPLVPPPYPNPQPPTADIRSAFWVPQGGATIPSGSGGDVAGTSQEADWSSDRS